MKSFTGKITSRRGWILLLAVLLGAGMMISACGDEETPAPTTPAPPPTTPTPPPDPEPTGPATPDNLRVTATTSTSITWSWDAAEGVLGYQGQFSPDTTFTDADPTFLVVAPATSHTVSNLSGNMTGYFRVRSGTGTALTDLTFSDWTDGVSGTTAPPPAAVAFDAPGGFTTGSATDDSITLSWDEVDDADSYEAEYRLAGAGGNWNDADCGDNGIVDGTSCVVSDLDEGTDYEFRVRALPAADDTVNATGEWAETDGSTTGQQQEPTSGGMGMANVRWHNGGTNNAVITFVWDRQGDAMYETYVLENAADIHKDNPCANVADVDSNDTPKYETKGAATSQDVDTTDAALGPGTVRGLCVREEGSSDASFAWGISPPEEPNNGTPDIDKLKTVALEWTDVDLKASFDYEVRLAADPERPSGDNNIGATSMAASRAVQSACDAGAPVDSFTPDINLDGLTVSVASGLSPNTGYLLCIRASNTAGTGSWAVPISNEDDGGYASSTDAGLAAEIFTRPAAPPRPGTPTSTSRVPAGVRNEVLAVKWEIDTRGVNNVPREHTDIDSAVYFNVEVFVSNTSGAASLNAAACGATTLPAGYTRLVNPSATDGLSGFSVEVAEIDRYGYTRKVYLCVQADSNNVDTEDADKGVGPWTISSQFTVSKPSTSLSNSNVTDTQATLTIKGWNNPWTYKTNVTGETCQEVPGGTDTVTLSGLTASTSYRVTAYDQSAVDISAACEEGNSLGSTSFRTTASQ